MSKYKLRPSRQAEAAVKAYKKIESAVVGSYQRIEDAAVGSYKRIEGKFVDAFLEREEEDPSSLDERRC